ncbi:MAG: MBL fold metallo-hydrolase [Bacteroidia bacterium]
MIIEQLYTGCLSQGAYYIESNGEAAIIDPLREVQQYINKAKKNGAQIKYVFETHFHADFVSGHLDLSQQTGAPIIYGPHAHPDFKAHVAADNEIFRIGNITLKAIHTPGHTLESTCYLLLDEQGHAKALFSGDTLFIGDVGRPDLAQKAAHMTQEQLAGMLYDSLRTKIMTLPDDVLVYPAHGAGSACGKNMSKETFDTLGNQKKNNYALRAEMSREDFIKEVTDGLLPPPSYFPLNVAMNKSGIPAVSELLTKGMHALSPDAFETAANATKAIILDTRDPQAFAESFIPNSINIGINGGFAPWVGALLPDVSQPILLVVDSGREEEVITRLARVGYDNTIGFLNGGVDAWKSSGRETDNIRSVNVTQMAEEQKTNKFKVLDVRKPSEYEAEHLIDAINIPLDFINDHIAEIDKDSSYFVHCAGGYRSMIFTSILKARGFNNLVDVKGGFKAIHESGLFSTTAFKCQNQTQS